MRTAVSRIAVSALTSAVVLITMVTPAAASIGAGAGVKDVCGHALSTQELGRPSAGTGSAIDVGSTVGHKLDSGDIFAADRPSATDRAAGAAHDALKEAMFRDGKIVSGATCATLAMAAQISWMYHYTQATSYFCGPAVVSEFSATVPGSSPYNLNQYTVANYMGTTTNGTNWSQETNGLNYYVGVPDFGWGFYGMAWMSDPPTAQQQTDFFNHLSSDVAVSSPIAGLAYEVAGGPHLVGHPVNQTIGHWIEIGGYDTATSKVWYADSAQNPWPNVPNYSWFDMYTMEVILGGAGYIW